MGGDSKLGLVRLLVILGLVKMGVALNRGLCLEFVLSAQGTVNVGVIVLTHPVTLIEELFGF